jgi:endonuclease YncB( thermonuclease family)
MRRIAVILLLLAPAAATAEPLPAGLTRGDWVRAVDIVDGDTLRIADGREVRLVGLQAPKLPLGRKGFRAWPLADAAKAALARLALGRRLRLAYGGRRIDRHRRILAHLEDADGTWIQAALLARGMARVYTFRDNRTAVRAMYRVEAMARRARRGIWGHRFYRVRAPAELPRAIGSFQVVEGRVRAVATVRGTTYLNFGADWRTDFTIMLRGRSRKLFRGAGVDPAGLDGRRIRVRGWLRSRNGPMIEATHPEQIELLD